MKLMKVLFVAAIVVAIAVPTFAAVQNIKVSGSIEERAIYLNNFDLKGKSEESTAIRFAPPTPAVAGSGNSIEDDQTSFVLQTVHVGVDSDLTDNVSASVVLSNQTKWGSNNFSDMINVNKAFITLKEFFYQPLTLKIGRQDLKFGSGFIVGPGIFRDPYGTYGQPTEQTVDRFSLLNVPGALPGTYPFSGPLGLQYTDATYYDAVRATLDLEPWTIDAIYSKVSQNLTASLDEELAGVNVGYKFDQYDAKAEAYYFYKNNPSLQSDMGLIDPQDLWNAQNLAGFGGIRVMDNVLDNTVAGAGTRIYDNETTHVFGMRGDIIPVENLALTGEGAVQWGTLESETGGWAANPAGELDRNKLAWAIRASGNYLWKDSSYKPNLGLGFEYLSGEESGNNGRWNAWDPMFRGNSLSLIRGYLAGQQAALNNIGGNIYQTLDPSDPSGSTDAITLYVDGGLKPMDDLSLKARYLHFWTAAKDAIGLTGGNSRSRNLGDEVDTSIVYDYTEDVQFDLTGGIYIPGGFYDDNSDTFTQSTTPAAIVTGGVKVAF